MQLLQDRFARVGDEAPGHLAFVPAHEMIAIERLHRSEEHTSELQSQSNLVCRLLLEKKKKINRSRCPSIITTRRRIRFRHYDSSAKLGTSGSDIFAASADRISRAIRRSDRRFSVVA